MVYKTEILNGIVNVNENDEKIYFNFDAMNLKQKELFSNYKREIVRESIQIDSNQSVKMDDNLINALNSNNVELDLTKLNPKQTFLLDCCIKELERKIDPDVYTKHKLHLKRKRNNECASKFRKKRKNYEKINEIIRSHLNDLVRQCKGNLKEEQIEQIKEFLNRNKLSITKKYFENNDDSSSTCFGGSSIATTNTTTTKSEISSNSSSSSASTHSSEDIESNCSIEEQEEKEEQKTTTKLEPKQQQQQQQQIKNENIAITNNFLNVIRGYPQYYAAAFHPALQAAAAAANGNVLTPVLFLPLNSNDYIIRPLIS